MIASSGVILHVPHSATTIPASDRESILLSNSELELEILSLTDHYTDELFAIPGALMVRYPVSRIVVDPERFEDDSQEMMSQVGMGVIYTKTCNERPLRNVPSPSEREALLSAYYRPHHAALTSAVEAALAAHGRCLVVDCHSFPSKPLPYERDQNPNRPDICIGTDPFHTPPELAQELVAAFTMRSYSVELNRPFAGALVPSRFYHSNANVTAVMIELNRALYIHESTGEKSSGFERTREVLSQVLQNLDEKHSTKYYPPTVLELSILESHPGLTLEELRQMARAFGF